MGDVAMGLFKAPTFSLPGPNANCHLLHRNLLPLSAQNIPDQKKKKKKTLLCVKKLTIMFHCPELRVRVRACVRGSVRSGVGVGCKENVSGGGR